MGLIAEAAGKGSETIVFVEVRLPGCPTFVRRLPLGAGMGWTDELFALSRKNAFDWQRLQKKRVTGTGGTHRRASAHAGHRENRQTRAMSWAHLSSPTDRCSK